MNKVILIVMVVSVFSCGIKGPPKPISEITKPATEQNLPEPKKNKK